MVINRGYRDRMHDDSDRVRLAELVAALSLGVDLGFGQPMEHVLRQCLIALRIAERVGLDESERATVYYTALLINVGCHTDAHEQAKWFGDDIALKAAKYDHGLRSVRAAVATVRRLGSGHPLLRRFRIGVEFAVRGHRDLDQMIEHHSTLARTLAEQLKLTPDVCDAVGAAYEQWDGRGWPGARRGDDVPVGARIAQPPRVTRIDVGRTHHGFPAQRHGAGHQDEQPRTASRRWGGASTQWAWSPIPQPTNAARSDRSDDATADPQTAPDRIPEWTFGAPTGGPTRTAPPDRC
jgi:hypothetical protein